MSVQGSGGALARKVDEPVAAVPAIDAATPAIPSQPTHVAFEVLKVYKGSGGAGEPVKELAPATTFSVVKTENGWSPIARDDRLLGFVEEARAKSLQ
ncbi:MAG: hypothetical protein WC807_07065 [Hyphomicrobium sp.]